jgi:hypothetical protein
MADQQQTLQLIVQFDDQASPGLEQLRKSLGDLAPTVQQSARQAKESVDEVSRAFGSLAREYLGVTRTLQEVAKISLAGATAGLAVVEMKRATDAMRDWARQGVEMGNAARMMGLSAGQFKNVTDQLRQAGISAQGATALVQNFNKAYAELMLNASKRRELFAMVGPQNAQAMANSLLQLRSFHTEIERINFVRQQGENVYRNEMARTHDTVLAAYKQQEYLQAFGAVQLMNVHQNLTQAEAKRLGLTNEINQNQRELLAAMEKERETREEIKDVINDMLSGPETKLINNMQAFEEEIVKRLEKIMDFGFNKGALGLPTPEEGLKQLQQHQQEQKPSGGWMPDFWNSLRNLQLPTLPENKSEFPDPLGDMLRNAFRRRNAAPTAAKFYGFADTGGGGNVIDDNSDEVHRLNLNMDRMLNLLEGQGGGVLGGGAGGGAGGGGGYGPTFRPGIGPGTARARSYPSTGIESSTGPGGGLEPAPGGGVTAAPLAAVMGAQPFGINVSDAKFTEITGLPASFKNVSPAQRAYAAQISTGMVRGGPGLDARFTGQKPAANWPQIAAPAVPTEGGEAGLAGDRAKYFAEMDKDPALRNKVLNIMYNEQGNSPEGSQAILESMMNRASTRHQTLAQVAKWVGEPGNPGYYQRGNMGAGKEGSLAILNAAMSRVQGGSNITKYATDNSSQGLAAGEKQPGSEFDWTGDFGKGGKLNESLFTRKSENRARSAWIKSLQPGTTAPQIAPTPSGITTSPVISGSGYTPIPTLTTTSGAIIKPDILAQAAALAHTGNTAAVQRFIASQGLSVDARDCGEFVASIIKASGGKPPESYTAGSTFAGVGTEVPGGLTSARPGDVLGSKLGTYGGMYGRPISPGQLGGHAAAIGPAGWNAATQKLEIIQADPVKDIFVGPGDKDWAYWSKFYSLRRLDDPNAKPPSPDEMAKANADLAKSQGLTPWPKDAASEDTRDTIARIQNDDRATLDKQQLAKATTSNIKINLRHRNAPPDVKVTASGDAFKGGTTERSNAAPAPAKPAEAPTKFKAGELEFG